MSNYNQYGMPQYNMPNFYQSQNQNFYVTVNGLMDAKNYPLGSNQSILMIDSNKPIVYKKTSNGLGQYTLDCYKLVQIKEQELGPDSPPKDYVSRADFEALVKRIDELTKKEVNE